MRWTLKSPGQNEILVELIRQDRSTGTFFFSVDGQTICLTNPKAFPFSIVTNEITMAVESWSKTKWRASRGSRTLELFPVDLGASSSTSQKEIRTQMPGRVLKVLAKEGDFVKPKQLLFILEAMKMENEIRSEIESTVKTIHVKEGQSLESGALLVSLD